MHDVRTKSPQPSGEAHRCHETAPALHSQHVDAVPGGAHAVGDETTLVERDGRSLFVSASDEQLELALSSPVGSEVIT